jgi:transcriptional regulator GlxA family with amidase domain
VPLTTSRGPSAATSPTARAPPAASPPAGATAGVDMCLHLVRPGVRATETGLGAVLEWLELHSHDDLALADLAAQAGLSVRTRDRRFHEETGRTPMQSVTGVRMRRAQELLETTDHGIERIAHLVGFASPAHFRTQFTRLSGVGPQAYRTAFRAQPWTAGSASGQISLQSPTASPVSSPDR